MRKNKIKPLCESFIIFTLLAFSSPAVAKQTKEITYTGRIVDARNQPIAGARVSLHGVTYNHAATTAESKLIEKIRTSNDGLFSFKAVVEDDSHSNGYIIAEKEAFALGWAEWEMQDSRQRDILLGEPTELSGTVVDKTGRPVPEARVSVWLIAIGEEQDQQRLGRPLAEQLLTVATDASGRFVFTNIPAEATADFIVRKSGKAMLRTFRSTGYANQKLTFSPGRADIKLVLSDESRIQGIVVNKETGQPVAGQKLIVKTSTNQSLFGQKPITTDQDGTFLIDALGAGRYIVQLPRPQATPADWTAEPVSVKLDAGQTAKDIKVELCKGGMLEVLVIEAETNKPLDKASVSIRDEKNKRWLSTRSGQDGIAQIRLIPGGYQLSGIYKQGYMAERDQQAVTIKEGATKRVTQKLNEMPKITGIVKNKTGSPIEGVQLKIMPGGREDVHSDSEGKFEIIWDKRRWGDREDTIFCLIARHEQQNLATALEINDDKTTLDLTLQPGVTFTGKVTDTNGKGISDARVRVMLQLSNWGSPLNREQLHTDANGDYKIFAIPPGHNYNINATAKEYGEKDVDAHTDNAVNNHLNVETITLPVTNLSVSGKIVDTEGHPVSGAQISGYGRNQPRPHTLSDNQGNFILEGLCEDTVYIRVNANRDGKRLSARVHTDAGAKGIKIAVREGRSASYYIASQTDEDIIRNNDKAIAGVVLDEKGIPVAGVPVSVCCHQKKREDGRNSWHYTTFIGLSDITDKRGHFAIAIQEDGKYNLCFSPEKHAAMIVYDIPVGTKDLKVTLSDGGTIEGRLVRMEKGEKVPIPNVEVKIEQTDRASYTHLGFDRDRTTVTDEEGRFKLEHVRTKIRPRGNRTAKKWNYTARYWKISYGDTSKTIAFHDSNTIDDFELIVKPDPSSSSPLIGNKIPGLDGIKINLSTTQIKNKKMLICFFDMNQRPSRHYINQLSRRAQELKAKEIVTVAIQAARVEEQIFNAWIQKSNADIPLGSIQTDPDEIKFKWGVRALPWLILTDNKHIVRAEGFSVGELDDRFEQIKEESHILHFPPDRSMGTLHVLDANRVGTSRFSDWELLGEAKGDVTVPAGKVTRLKLGKKAGDDLSPLSVLAPNDLMILNCHRVDIADDQLSHISHLTGLKEIYLGSTNIIGTGLKYFAQFKLLEELTLSHTHVGDNELAYLSHLPSLKDLDLRSTPTGDAGMIHIGKIDTLETLLLSRQVGDEGLSHLRHLTSLRFLLVKDPSITDKGLSHLTDMTEMEFLHLSETQISNQGLRHLKRMKKLKKLNLWGTRITEDGLVHLKDFTHLEDLRLGFPLSDVGLSHLSNLTSLKSVEIDENSVTSQGLDILSKMKSLEEVSIDCKRKDGHYKTDAVVKKVAGSLKLKSIFICEGLTDEGLVCLKDMPSLEKLDIFWSQVTGKSISILAKLPRLKEVSLVEPKLTRDEWIALGKLSSLEYLSLHWIRSPKIKDTDIAHLSGLHRLKRLIISPELPDDEESMGLDITEKGFIHIAKLKSLENLGLTGARITSEGLRHLAGLKALKYLSFERCKVSERDLEELKKTLPELRWGIF